MATVYSYLRFSRPEQMGGDSSRRQSITKEWAEKEGHTLDNTLDLRDLGVSAFRGKHAKEGALADFLEAIESGRVEPGSILAIESLDRLSRQEVDDAREQWRKILLAGVDIKTFEPNEFFTAGDLNNPFRLMMAIIIMTRAHEESATKSHRLKEAWREKRNQIGNQKLTSICPKWLMPIDAEGNPVLDRNGKATKGTKAAGFKPIDNRVEVVERIFALGLDGMGQIAIAKALNADNVPTFGRADFWSKSIIAKILRSRAVLGEYQPHRIQDGRRVPVGEPIKDYFPRVIDDLDFYRVQQLLQNRATQPGRHGKRVTNLFTGLLVDARDGSRCEVALKNGSHQIVSKAARNGTPGAVYLSFPYVHFEQAFFVWAYDLNIGDVLPRKATNLEKDIAKAEGRVADLQNRIETLRSKMKTADNFDALVDLLVELEGDKAAAEEKVDALRRQQATSETEALDRTKELIERLRDADEDERYRLRLKLRSMLKRLVDDVVILTVQANNDRLALVDVKLKNGERRQLTIVPGKLAPIPDGIEDRDIRQWRRWPKKLKATRFDIVTDEGRRLLALDDEGLDRTEIAERMGWSLSRVSRALIRHGRRKRPRKKADSERMMTWHPQGRGWVKRHKGQRHYIGLGTLAERYPKLLKSKTAEGSWKAANAWWQDKLQELSR